MHYQLVVLDSEIGSSMTISSIAWQRAPSGSDQGHYYNVMMYMGLCEDDQLSSTFESNWVPDTKTLVFSADTLDLAAGANEWEAVTLDMPYWYDGQQNLLIDLQWSSANTGYSFYTWKWETGAARSIKATSLPSPTGILSTQMSELMIEGTLTLDQVTFGEIKAVFVGDER
jgi:hypothetical protein